MKAALIILALLLFHLDAVSQFKGEWKPLPKVKGTPAIVTKRAAKIASRTPVTKPFKIQETYYSEKFKFQSIVKPDTLDKLEFAVYDLSWREKKKLPNGFLFKDIATTNTKYLDKAHGLMSNMVTCMTEDKNGLMYIGTDMGLSVYNDAEILIYSDPLPFSFYNIESLTSDSEGRVWIATEKGVAYIYDNKLHVSKKQIIEDVEYHAFRQNNNGEFFIFSSNGLFILKEAYTLHYKNGLPDEVFCDAIRTDDDKLWIAFMRYGMGYIKSDSLFVLHDEKTPFNDTRSFAEGEKSLWIGGFNNTLKKYRNDSLFIVNLGGNSNYVYSIEKSRLGIYLTIYGGGLFLIKPSGDILRYYENNGLAGNLAFKLYIDSYDNIWVADLFKGISRVDENAFHQVPNKKISDFVFEIEIDSAGNTWYFKNGGLLTKGTENEYLEYVNEPFTKYQTIRFARDGFIRDDEVWMASYDFGIVNLSLSNMEYTFYQKDEIYNTILLLEEDSLGGIWGISLENELLYFHKEIFYDYSHTHEWKNYEFIATNKTASGKVFITTEKNGTFLIRDSSYLKLSFGSGTESEFIHHIYEDTESVYWFFYDGKIILQEKNSEVFTYRNSILMNNPIRDFIEVAHNKYLGISDNGIVSISRDSLGLEISLSGIEDGLYMVDNISISKNAKKQVIITRNKNLITYDNSLLHETNRPPKLSLSQLIVNDSLSITDLDEINIAQKSSIEFVFNKIYWGKSSKLSYELLRNKSSIIKNIETTNSISIEGLSHGKYELVVLATDGKLDSKQLNYKFSITPYWYQTTYAALTGVLFFLLLTAVLVAIREKNAKERRKELEKLVDEKTHELQSEKNEVTKQLSEKELLLKEVNHRVKNNMQMISSMLELQSLYVNDEKSKASLKESVERVKALALAHQKLYKNDGYTYVSISEYLGVLVDNVLKNTDCKMNLKIDKGYKMHIEKAQALGFIVNELISNSIKYAWDIDDSDRQVELRLETNGSRVMVAYSDNGRGFPKNYKLSKNTSLGSTLILSFVTRQLGGIINTSNRDGANIIINFNKTYAK